ncbi:YCF48-related protein [Bacteroidota bacterium]
MIHLLTVVIIFFITFCNLQAQWKIIHKDKWDYLSSVEFVNNNIGFVIANDFQIIKTSDGGKTWENHYIIEDVVLDLLHFIDEKYGWVLGYKLNIGQLNNYQLFNTTDGGDTWNKIEFNFEHIIDYQFVTKDKGFVVYSYGDPCIIETCDGGISWQDFNGKYKVKLLNNTYLNAFYLNSENIGWAVGTNGLIMKTLDGCHNWKRQGFGDGIDPYYSVFFLNEDIGWVGGENQVMKKTTDGGETWILQDTSSSKYNIILDIFFVNEDTGFACGKFANVLRTTNGGNEWNGIDLGVQVTMRDIDFVNNKTGYLVGDNGIVIKTTNCGESWTKNTVSDDDLYSVSFTTDMIGYVSGENGIVKKSTDGGSGWIDITIPSINGVLMSILFINATTGWTISSTGKIYKTTDGGENWIVQHESNSILTQLFFISEEKGFVIGSSGLILRTDDRGENWIQIPGNLEMPIANIFLLEFYNENIGWIISNDKIYGQGGVLKTIDGGLTWEKKYDSTASTILPVSKTHSYFVGNTGFKTSDGGETWTEIGDLPFFIGQWDYLDYQTIYFIVWRLHDTAFYRTGDGFETWDLIFEKRWFQDVDCVDSNTVCVIDNRIQLTNNRGANWDVAYEPMGYIYDINFTNENDTWILTSEFFDNSMYKSSDGGLNWSKVIIGDQFIPWSVHFNNEGIGWIGVNNGIYRTVNGSESWDLTAFDTLQVGKIIFREIYFWDDYTGWAIPTWLETTQNDYIFYSNDGGINWLQQHIPGRDILESIDFVTVDIGFMVGESELSEGVLYKTTDSGDNWERLFTGFVYFDDIDQVTEQKGYACGKELTNNYEYNAVIYKTTDSWVSWQVQYQNSNEYLHSLQMFDENIGWACGTYSDSANWGGIIIATNTESDNWEEIYREEHINLRDIQFLDDKVGWIAGGNGLILRTTNGGVSWIKEDWQNIPLKYFLHQNYPNPFNPTTTIKYTIPTPLNPPFTKEGKTGEFVELKVYDILGRKIATLVNEAQRPGYYEVEWDASSSQSGDGQRISSGIYFYRIVTPYYSETKKMLLLR